MKHFKCSVTGALYEFENNVTATQQPDGTYRFSYTTDARGPKILVKKAVYGPDIEAVDANDVVHLVPGPLLSPAEYKEGDLIVHDLPDHPTTLQPFEYVAPTEEELQVARDKEAVEVNGFKRDQLVIAAQGKLAHYSTAIALDMATDEEKSEARAIVQYIRDLKALEIGIDLPDFPPAPF